MGRKRKDIIESDEVKISRTPRKWNPISREMIESSSGDEEDIEICPVCQDKNDPSNPGVRILSIHYTRIKCPFCLGKC